MIVVLYETLTEQYARVSAQVIGRVRQSFEAFGRLPELRIHGDCHAGNILWREQGPLFVDLDDCMSGPRIQDLWMFLAGDAASQQSTWAALMEGYELFGEFDYTELTLVESLRSCASRGLIALRWHDPAFPRAFPPPQTRFWERHISDFRTTGSHGRSAHTGQIGSTNIGTEEGASNDQIRARASWFAALSAGVPLAGCDKSAPEAEPAAATSKNPRGPLADPASMVAAVPRQIIALRRCALYAGQFTDREQALPVDIAVIRTRTTPRWWSFREPGRPHADFRRRAAVEERRRFGAAHQTSDRADADAPRCVHDHREYRDRRPRRRGIADILHSRNSCRACVSRWRRTGAFPTARGGKALRKLIPRDDFGSRFTGAPIHQTYHAIWSVFASLCQNRRKVHLLTTALIPT
jgi:hypothetical protein